MHASDYSDHSLARLAAAAVDVIASLQRLQLPADTHTHCHTILGVPSDFIDHVLSHR